MRGECWQQNSGFLGAQSGLSQAADSIST